MKIIPSETHDVYRFTQHDVFFWFSAIELSVAAIICLASTVRLNRLEIESAEGADLER